MAAAQSCPACFAFSCPSGETHRTVSYYNVCGTGSIGGTPQTIAAWCRSSATTGPSPFGQCGANKRPRTTGDGHCSYIQSGSNFNPVSINYPDQMATYNVLWEAITVDCVPV